MQTSWEVEQKFILSDPQQFAARLESLGFKPTVAEEHQDLYFRHPCRDFRETDEAFRLRKVNDDAVVTYKGKRLDAEVKTRPEIELELKSSEFEQWETMLCSLGFSPLPKVCKTRQMYKCDHVDLSAFCVTIDRVEQLGCFAEIELLIESQDKLLEAQEQIEKLAEELQLKDVQTLSYLAQLLRKLGVE